MRRSLPCLSSILLLGASAGCASTAATHVHSDAALGRVVVYRNGVAYFERRAHVEGDTLRLSVPVDKIDDFLKSLTVVDAKTGEPPPIAYPTKRPSVESDLIDLEVRLGRKGVHDLFLTYVTEAPAWKPTYRIALGDRGSVVLQGWAIVDNTSGEDWNGVRLGVGSSSALSFRYDLDSVRSVRRETLSPQELFAQAPPTGGSTYGAVDENGNRVLGEVSPTTIAGLPPAGASQGYSFSDDPVTEAGKADSSKKTTTSAPPAKSRGRQRSLEVQPADNDVDRLAQALAGTNKTIIIEGYGGEADGDKNAAALDRANRVRKRLIERGMRPEQVVAQANNALQRGAGGVRVLEAAPAVHGGKDDGKAARAEPVEPIGASHFESSRPMNVARGTSAMVSILNSRTKGEVVYLYDPESARGNATFPFRSVRVQNPTESTLETGPVTVTGGGKFIGEGICEPIPAHSIGFVPFALDRQIVVDHEDGERDKIGRILTVQRGVLSTEIQHTRRLGLTLHNRLPDPVVVYVRHSVASGYHLVDAPAARERLGGSDLFRVEIGPNGKAGITIEEATPVFKTVDVRTPAGMDLVEAYLSSSEPGPLHDEMRQLLSIHREMANVEQQIQTTREQMGEFRERMNELHGQIVTLRAVRTAGAIIQHLEKKLQEMTDKLSTSTVELAKLEEKLMLARIRFQDGVAELSLEKDKAPAAGAQHASR